MDELQNNTQKNRTGSTLLKLLLAVGLLAVFAGATYGTYAWQQRKIDKLDKQVASLRVQLDQTKTPTQATQQAVTYTSKNGTAVKVYTPEKNAKVVSPLGVVGQVPGNWSFEASFPVLLKDSTGATIAQTTAQVLGDWMTDQPVTFSAKLVYASAASGDGMLVLQKDNPSGLPANDDSVSIPVKL